MPPDPNILEQLRMQQMQVQGQSMAQRANPMYDLSHGGIGQAGQDAGAWAGRTFGTDPNAFMPQNPYQFSQGFGGLPGAAGMLGQAQAGMAGSDPSQVRGQQSQFLQMMLDQAQGRGPSMAQDQLRKASEANYSQAMSMAAGTQGGGSAGALRDLGYQRAQIGQQQAQDSGLLRAQEMLAGRSMYGQALQGARGQDEQSNQFWGQMGFGVNQAQQQGALQGGQIASGYDAQLQALRQRAALASSGNAAGMLNGLGSMLGIGK